MAGTACCGVRADATITDRCITRVTRFAAAVTGVASEESFTTTQTGNRKVFFHGTVLTIF